MTEEIMYASQFPPEFLWGTATAAYQIEGSPRADGKGESIWDRFTHERGIVLRGDTGDIACDHYNRWPEDIELLSDLGVNSYRYSIAWTRVDPAGDGRINKAGLDFYERITDRLLERNISPLVTLYHWDLPQALQDKGGWLNRETAERFADFTSAVAERLGDRVPRWLTLNEPYCSAFVGHLQGVHAPGIQDEASAVRAAHHLLLAHGRGLEALRAADIAGQAGITLNLTSVIPGSISKADRAAAARVDLVENRLFLDPIFRGRYPEDAASFYRGVTGFDFVEDGDLDLISGPIDFFGINYYERHTVVADPADPQRGSRKLAAKRQTLTGTAINPRGLEEVLKRVSREYTPLPLIVTETGVALTDYVDPEDRIRDAERIVFFQEHIAAAASVMKAGVRLVGFYPWSFMDNFEWQWGYGHRYGMYYVDYATQRRIPKDSALWYADFLEGARRDQAQVAAS
ncbi:MULTISPECIES: GH1 family beta-glucosidase [unclassified Leifsonia]|uniref:GH1 family beta-glucosidase n=1 Tax=unclassified Leifsonia TaxID=2663824 RepID=UPI0008A7FB0A|nr:MULTISPECIES: GH1 family beta-glucosidase [unclassified Leifsonia]SEI14632.1 broad-specificity cellobiase [Leifsonia sp. CL154]SFM02287.1 broad-specificity cellobiase [Leifsonia sp. CL147]